MRENFPPLLAWALGLQAVLGLWHRWRDVPVSLTTYLLGDRAARDREDGRARAIDQSRGWSMEGACVVGGLWAGASRVSTLASRFITHRFYFSLKVDDRFEDQLENIVLTASEGHLTRT